MSFHGIKLLVLVLVSIQLSLVVEAKSAEFPIKNGYKASLLSVMKPKKMLETVHKLPIGAVTLNVRLQDSKGAPLLFILPGLGGASDSYLSELLAHQAFISGYHTINLINPIHPSFVKHISSHGFVGNFFYDVKDLIKLMKSAIQQLEGRINPTFYSFVGFSLGGSLTPLVELEDRKAPFFNFKHVIMLNPGASITYATKIIDGLYDVKPRLGAKGFSEDVARIIMGHSFRKSLRKVLDETMNTGSIPVKGMNFENYLNRMIRNLSEVEDLTFSDRFNFSNYANLFSEDKKFFVVHNRNDFLLRDKDIEFYENNFGNRFTLFEYGGHCGNYWFPPYQEFFRKILKSAL